MFVHDRETGATARVSVDSAGAQAAGGDSGRADRERGRPLRGVLLVRHRIWSPATRTAPQTYYVHDRETDTTERVTVTSAGLETGGAWYDRPSLSADGRYVAFSSPISGVVPDDTNASSDVFVHDRGAHTTERVSVDSTGAQANGGSWFGPSLSADGRHVAFESEASNLVAGDTNAKGDVFVRNRDRNVTERVSVDSAGVASNGHSYEASLSGDGRHVAFTSEASNLVAGDFNAMRDVFVHERDLTAPPTGLSTMPTGPANDNAPKVKGTAEAGSTVTVYTDPRCTGASAASGSAAAFANPGLPVTVTNDSSTTFYAVATDTDGDRSGCSMSSATYVEDSTGPTAPSGLATSPVSPANNNAPKVTGSAAAGSTVRIYTNATCTSAVAATGTAATFASPGLAVSVGDDTTTNFHATAADAAGNASACSSSSTTYVEQSSVPPPAAPTGLASNPASPAADNAPRITGAAEPGSYVYLYGTADCSGPLLANGTAADFASPGLLIWVYSGSSQTVYANAAGAGGTSPCSTSSVTYQATTAASGEGGGAGAPTGGTQSADAITATAAALHGFVYVSGGTVTYRFEYGTTAAYTHATGYATTTVGPSGSQLSQSISGLSPGTIYHYRIVAMNGFGTLEGSDVNFTTTSTGTVTPIVSPAPATATPIPAPTGTVMPQAASVTPVQVAAAADGDLAEAGRAMKRRGLRKLARLGKFPLKADGLGAGAWAFSAKAPVAGAGAAAAVVFAKGRTTFSAAGVKKVTLKLTRKGRRIARRARRLKLKLTVSFTLAGKSKVTRSKTVKLRR